MRGVTLYDNDTSFLFKTGMKDVCKFCFQYPCSIKFVFYVIFFLLD